MHAGDPRRINDVRIFARPATVSANNSMSWGAAFETHHQLTGLLGRQMNKIPRAGKTRLWQSSTDLVTQTTQIQEFICLAP